VRRVAVTLRWYGIQYEHRRLSVWGDAEAIARSNPLRRVPTLIWDDGTPLLETFAICDALDELAGADRALLPARGAQRRQGLRIVSLGSGLADKAVSLLYEGLFRPQPSQRWVERCRSQIGDTLELLERELSSRGTAFFLGMALSHADIAVACALRFIREAHPGLFDESRFLVLGALAGRCEAMPEFSEVSQPLVNRL
jgi:glutathione S-transferase